MAAIVTFLVSGAVVVVIALAVAALSRAPALPSPLEQALAAPPWKKLDFETWTLDREARPTIFVIPSNAGQHRLWLHYSDDDAGHIPGLTVEACAAPASPSGETELPGLPGGLRGSVSFEVLEGSHWVAREARAEDIEQARGWLADAGPLAPLPGSKLSIEPSHSGGFRIHLYWKGGPDELAVVRGVAESVESRIVRRLRDEREELRLQTT